MGHVHFDWSYINNLPQDKIDVITMLRHPVKLAVSQFYYAKTLKWTAGTELQSMELGEYLQNPSEMIKLHTLWADGQAATWWLTGMHIESWVNVDQNTVKE